MQTLIGPFGKKVFALDLTILFFPQMTSYVEFLTWHGLILMPNMIITSIMCIALFLACLKSLIQQLL
jgi:hypothetical protein